jgi:hypothetical protein
LIFFRFLLTTRKINSRFITIEKNVYELGENEVVDFVIKRLQIAPMLMTEWRLGRRELETEKKALFVLGLLVRESLASRNKLPQFPPHHLLRNQSLLVDLPIMNRESQAHEIGQNCRRASLSFNCWGARGRRDCSRKRKRDNIRTWIKQIRE